VWIPKIYNGRNKTFFFVAYEGFPQPRRRECNHPLRSNAGDVQRRLQQVGGTRTTSLLPSTILPRTRANPNGSGSIRDVFPNNQIPASPLLEDRKLNCSVRAGVNTQSWIRAGTSGYVRNNYIVNKRN